MDGDLLFDECNFLSLIRDGDKYRLIDNEQHGHKLHQPELIVYGTFIDFFLGDPEVDGLMLMVDLIASREQGFYQYRE